MAAVSVRDELFSLFGHSPGEDMFEWIVLLTMRAGLPIFLRVPARKTKGDGWTTRCVLC